MKYSALALGLTPSRGIQCKVPQPFLRLSDNKPVNLMFYYFETKEIYKNMKPFLESCAILLRLLISFFVKQDWFLFSILYLISQHVATVSQSIHLKFEYWVHLHLVMDCCFQDLTVAEIKVQYLNNTSKTSGNESERLVMKWSPVHLPFVEVFHNI